MICGVDLSSLEETEFQGGKFYESGRPVDPFACLAQKGITSVRFRLWVDPYGEKGEPYMGGTCDIERVIRLARRAKEQGMSLLLDLHYSDFWCDPSRQMIPKAWQGLDLQGLCHAIYDYTAQTLERLKSENLEPAAVQVGNEITNGMLWPIGKLEGQNPEREFDALAALLRSGAQAVRDHSNAKVVLHLEQSGKMELWQWWFDAMVARNVDFDILGASYYPYWHGNMDGLKRNLENCIGRYGKDIYIVETGFAYRTPDNQPGDLQWDGTPLQYPQTPAGQASFLKDLLELTAALPHGRGKGVWWWEPCWIPTEGAAWASEASLRYCHEEGADTGSQCAPHCLFDERGNALPALDILGQH